MDRIFRTPWNLRDGRVVPEDETVSLDGGGVELDATFLYADLSDSSGLVTRFTKNVAGKVMRAYLSGMSRLVLANGGTVTNFDGDRVMAVFAGPGRAAAAATAALEMNYVLAKVIRPAARRDFPQLAEGNYNLSHAVGIDVGSIRAVRAGRRNANDLVWIGRAPAFAAKLSALDARYWVYVSQETYDSLPTDLRVAAGQEPRLHMWSETTLKFVDQDYRVMGTTWYMEP